jgi:hypothetical protein
MSKTLRYLKRKEKIDERKRGQRFEKNARSVIEKKLRSLSLISIIYLKRS